MSLARTLMNGGFVGSLECDINPARYGHAQGATVIAMESVEELHEIFLESYNYEQAELAAATEGVALEGSQYEAVAEAAIGDMFKKIKDFFVKLWNKVKAFFHEVRKYLDSIFMSGKDFCKKYDKEIRKLDNLKDFSYKMFKYDDATIDEVDKETDIEGAANAIVGTDGIARLLVDLSAGVEKGSNQGDVVSGGSGSLDDVIKKMRADDMDDQLIKACTDGKCTSVDDYDEYLFGLFRNGAKDTNDKEELDLTSSDIQKFSDVLKSSKAISNFSKVQTSSDKVYKKAIDMVNNAEKKWSAAKGTYASKAAELLRAYSSLISKNQNYCNRMINAWKVVAKERDSVYKSCIMAAMSNNRKNSK